MSTNVIFELWLRQTWNEEFVKETRLTQDTNDLFEENHQITSFSSMTTLPPEILSIKALFFFLLPYNRQIWTLILQKKYMNILCE